jgi:hypothetical protein
MTVAINTLGRKGLIGFEKPENDGIVERKPKVTVTRQATV